MRFTYYETKKAPFVRKIYWSILKEFHVTYTKFINLKTARKGKKGEEKKNTYKIC